ncbi:ATP-binding cassette domain-containing protein [Candidatus Marithrix sp. Canyon 246]|uniref:ATP-binding cassette domain-containing protein n=1 Tax=Candidatus Marithrix sp. Canyon 246 TaxID=1827136 RepID=UPI00084A1ED3|nr:ATP-binding cassette domain-containing protein [Candidatus Marithrix sp. Canyon 246]
MSLINIDNVSIAFGHVALLDNVNLRIEKAERVCLIGRNGEGKSTLLKLINKNLHPDKGKIEYQTACRVALLNQNPEFNPDDTIFHAVAQGLGKIGELVNEYHEIVQAIATDDSFLKKLEVVQQRLEAEDGWSFEQRVETILSRLQLPADQKISNLSGGWQRRVALAQALVTEPDLLLLDEPTNHLDIEAIAWLEQVLLEFNGGLLFISHDREFMQRLATRIIELDRGQLTSYPGDYATYLRQKQANLAAEAIQAAKFDKKLAQEEIWIRQGIKARRTRNEGRVRSLEKLREERSQRREQVGKVKLKVETGESSGRIVIEAENINKSYQDTPLIKDFSTVIMRGDKIGLIGGNGVGKTTLLKILLDQLAPDSGKLKHGTKLSIAYFDQLRDQLNLEETVVDSVAQGQDFITINDQKKHIMSYLSDFLFAPARARSPVKSLSGGERNRLLLARLFTKSANVLVLDEPTNDLDVESLELLEELLLNYPGTLLLVSHDRRFLDNVVTSSIVFEGNATINEYVGGYKDIPKKSPEKKVNKKTTKKTKNKTQKLNYNQQHELSKLPAQIEGLETEQTELQQQTSDPEFYQADQSTQNKTLARLKEIESELQHCYKRWEQLENL